jgi:hypothetical protein
MFPCQSKGKKARTNKKAKGKAASGTPGASKIRKTRGRP